MLLDSETPWKVIGRTTVPLRAPETDYETKTGFRTQVIFPTAAIALQDTLRIYYGASDTVIAVAEAGIQELIQACLNGK